MCVTSESVLGPFQGENKHGGLSGRAAKLSIHDHGCTADLISSNGLCDLRSAISQPVYSQDRK